MTKGLKDSKTEIKARSRKDEPTAATSRKNADSQSLAAIQEKVSKFQPKIDALLPRMLSGSTSAAPPKDSSSATTRSRGATTAPLSEAIAKVSAGSKSAAAQSKSTTVKPATGQDTAPKARKVAATAAPVSIADRIPKGSRTRPIPTLANATTPQPSTTAAKQPGDQPDEAIILLSSLPSFSQEVEDLAISNADIRLLETEFSDKSDDEPLIDRRRQQTYTTEAYATTHTIATVAAIEQPASRNDAATIAAKSHSVISIGSCKSDLSASIIPSIDKDRITNWMGGVKEALGDDPEGVHSNTTKLAVTAPDRAERVDGTPELEGTTTTLRSKDDVVGTDREEDCPRILVKDSLSLAPPVPLFHEDQVVEKDDLATITPHQGPSQDPDLPDDVSTVLVGGQPTQDSYALRSLPSYYYEKDDKAPLSDSEREEEADDLNSAEQQRQQQQSRRSPSLPSGLTASCLQELGLEKKRRNSGQGSRSAYQKRRSGVASSCEEVGSSYETMILAQGDVFPSSVGEAPVSSHLLGSPSLSSFDLPDPPRYTYALPDRTAQLQQDDDEWDIQQGQQPNSEMDDDDTQEYPQPIEIQDSLSFPLPPFQTSFTISLPTMPTFPSTIHSEPSLIIVGSQLPETQESDQES
ncbi:hypothetical protein BGZ70_004514 [Mortierella alpina]|uniref:Uncharacterized protein n=1 Tax=Mortierella alpina TaxID=64518 RepID=A0A9P6LVE2_MORAP|nr:hypothetical protein BGZ70_004514 [Mortierella alpina]